jgi:hypothetical protein
MGMIIKRRHALFVWLVGTLLAIALIGDAPYLGLGIAILSGIVFGIVNLIAFKPDP